MSTRNRSRNLTLAALLAATLCMSGAIHAREQPHCAATLGELDALAGDAPFALAWDETTMADGKPLRVAISERHGALYLQFVKAGEGLWAESTGRICKAGAGLEARFGAHQIKLGPAAHWALRMALGQGGKFTLTRLGADRLSIATTGWSGNFAAARY